MKRTGTCRTSNTDKRSDTDKRSGRVLLPKSAFFGRGTHVPISISVCKMRPLWRVSAQVPGGAVFAAAVTRRVCASAAGVCSGSRQRNFKVKLPQKKLKALQALSFLFVLVQSGIYSAATLPTACRRMSCGISACEITGTEGRKRVTNWARCGRMMGFTSSTG